MAAVDGPKHDDEHGPSLPDPRPGTVHTLLVWDGATGVARHKGVSHELDGRPDVLKTLHLRGIRYLPEMHQAEVRESSKRWRRMTDAERAEVNDYLERMAGAFHGVAPRGTLP